jgi:hypothetical protein
MPIRCPQCSQVNPDQSGFCLSCGSRLQLTGQSQPTSNSPSLPTFAGDVSNSPPSYPPSSPFTTGPSSAPPSFPASAGSAPPSFPTASQWQTGMVAPPPPGTQMGTAQGMASIRRAFAGHGTLVAHHSWLLSGYHAHAGAVHDATRDKLQQRGIAKLKITPETLMERGLLMEERDYLVAQRGICTVFIYVAPAGQDLYLSRATTVLPAISNIRVVILGLLFLIMFFGFFSRPSPTDLLYGNTLGFLFASIFAILSAPILLFFIFLLIRSFIYWLREKDFWRYLRPNFLNDFNLDDLMILEQVTDGTVYDAVKQVGLDATKIVPPATGYQPKQKIRAL